MACDLYGFPVALTELQKAECQQCEAQGDAAQPTWMSYIEKDKLPPKSDSKIKELIRKVGINPQVFGLLTTINPVDSMADSLWRHYTSSNLHAL